MRPGAIEIASRVLGGCACRRALSRIFQAAISMLIAREAFFGVYGGRIVCSRGLRASAWEICCFFKGIAM